LKRLGEGAHIACIAERPNSGLKPNFTVRFDVEYRSPSCPTRVNLLANSTEDYMPWHSAKWVSYLRVSTDRQGHAGWGIEAQRKTVDDFLKGGGWALAREFVEVESASHLGRWVVSP
jgi:hypothetical protein